jgi:hypothetical protein
MTTTLSLSVKEKRNSIQICVNAILKCQDPNTSALLVQEGQNSEQNLKGKHPQTLL